MMEIKNLPGNLFTIGYSGFTLNNFIDTLNDLNINVIIDVRSVPYSKRFPDYNLDNLKFLVSNTSKWRQGKAYYLNLKDNFGARQTNLEYYTIEKYLDFEKFRQSDIFLEGCKRVHTGLSLGYNIVLLCAEIEPIQCHRAIMITRWFDMNGYKITHILPQRLKTQNDVDEELLEKYFHDCYNKNSYSCSLLYLNKSPDEIRKENIEKAYQKQNRVVGYRLRE